MPASAFPARVAPLVLCLTLLPAGVGAATWNFTQTGWSANFIPTGGIVTGSFSGDDNDRDGVLDRSELTDYEMSFRDDAIVNDFSHDLADLRFFRYTVGSGGFPPSFPLFSDNGALGYDADDGVIALTLGAPQFEPRALISTLEPARVAPVPLPSGSQLVLACFGLLAAVSARWSGARRET